LTTAPGFSEEGGTKMKALNLFCAGAVLLCALVLSYHHSVELMAAGGYQGIYRHLAVVLAELTFLAGAANVVLARIQKRPPGIPPVLGALFGVALTGWANISAGVEYGITGILLGAMVPVALVISEAILAHFLLRGVGVTSTNTSPEGASKSTSTPSIKHQAPVITNSHQASVATKPPAATSQSEPTAKHTTSDKPTSNKPTSNKPTTAQKKGKKETVDIEVERAKRVAKRILEEEGKLPGRPRLMKEAGIRENPARKALEELKQAL